MFEFEGIMRLLATIAHPFALIASFVLAFPLILWVGRLSLVDVENDRWEVLPQFDLLPCPWFWVFRIGMFLAVSCASVVAVYKFLILFLD
jgi:hypothetical protein